jgi:hypothetical protein
MGGDNIDAWVDFEFACFIQYSNLFCNDDGIIK